MYGGMSHKLSMLRKKSTADVTPDPIDWPSVTGTSGSGYSETTTQTISGITVPITLKIEYYDDSTRIFTQGGGFKYSLNGGSAVTISASPPDSSAPATFNLQVSNNNTLKFSFSTGINTATLTVTVKNGSDNDIVLDTFTLTSTGEI